MFRVPPHLGADHAPQFPEACRRIAPAGASAALCPVPELVTVAADRLRSPIGVAFLLPRLRRKSSPLRVYQSPLAGCTPSDNRPRPPGPFLVRWRSLLPQGGSTTRHRYSLLPVLLLAALALVVTTSHAAGRTAVSESLQGTPQKVAVGTPQDVIAVCLLGVTGKAARTVDHLAPPDDAYYTLLDPETCGCPGTSGVRLPNAHVLLDFPVACSIPASVAVVKADMSDERCPVPMPGAYICEPISYKVSVEEAGSYDFTLPLNAGDCITQKAFLVITFLEEGECKELPMLITTDGCDACASYSVSRDGADDLCKVLPGNPNMYVEATCCDEVPAHRATWGQVKTLYR